MTSFEASKLYVPLNNEHELANRVTGSQLRDTGVRLAIGANATEVRGMFSLLGRIRRQGYSKTFADMHYSSVPHNLENSFSLFQRLGSIGYVSIDGRVTEQSLREVAKFNSDDLQVVVKGVDSGMSEEEYLRRFGKSIEYDTNGICETALECGINAIMLAGADAGLVARGYPEMTIFATGIRTTKRLKHGGSFMDDQQRTSNPVMVLEEGGPNVNLVCGRPITTAIEPALAVDNLLTYIRRG